MAKKKKKKKRKPISLLQEVDKTIDNSYKSLMEEIEDLQIQLNIADQKARKRAKKKLKKNPNYFGYTEERLKARKKVIQKMEGTNLLERAQRFFQALCPVVVVVARLIACLITSILSIDIVKTNIKPSTLEKIDTVYKTAMSIC